MHTGRSFIAACCVLSGCACVVHAQYRQQGHATWRWEGSVDGGASWRGGRIELLHSPGVVLVRAIVTFEDFGTPSYCGGVGLDPYVLTTAPGDDIISFTAPHGSASRLESFPANPVRLPGLLKLDAAGDLLPPGQGPGWFRATQPGYQIITSAIMDNPIWLMGFTLVIDGTGGDRTISAVFRESPLYPGRPMFVETRPWLGYGYAETLDHFPLTISVFPSPSGAALGAFAACWFGARRRRA